MAKPFDFGDVKLTAGDEDENRAEESHARKNLTEERQSPTPDAETPFRIALLGDFSGRESRDRSEPGTIGKRRAIEIDRDNFDEVMAKIAPEIRLPLGDEDLRLRFTELEDFHPDRLFENVSLFDRLRAIRERLKNPNTFASAAAELGLTTKGRAESGTRETGRPNASSANPPSATRLASGSLLDELVAQTEARAPEERPRRAPDEVREFARRAAEELTVASADPQQAEVLAVIDRALSGQMRALLHNADFQALEAAWRSVFFLVRRLETDSRLKLHLVDISETELAADLTTTQDLGATGLCRLVVEQTVGTPGAEPWALLAGNYTFGASRKDADLLARIAKIANAAGAPFFAAASPALVGCSSFATTPEPREWNSSDADGVAAWAALRSRAESASIGLVMPRFLLRMPYGSKSNPIDSFEFEEMTSTSSHEDYLWGNAAFAATLLMGQSFSQSGWEMRPGTISGIDGLPLHVYDDRGESALKPCSEALLTEDAATRIMDRGIMPLVSLKGRDTVRLVRFQSIASPLRALAGRWNG